MSISLSSRLTRVAAALPLLVAAVGGAAGVDAPSVAAATAAYTVVGPTQKIRPADAVGGASSAQLMAAGNEFTSFQVVIPGGASGVTGVSVSPGTALSGPGGSIPAGNMTIYREAYYTSTQASIAGRPVGPWPDALIPAVDSLYHEPRNAFPVDVPASQNRVAFVDLLVPQNQAAGPYDGNVVLTAAGAQVSIPVHLDVRGFTLPATSSLSSLFRLNWLTPCQATHPGCTANDEQQAWSTNYDYARAALDDRISIANAQFQPPANSTETSFFNQYLLPLINGTGSTQLPGAKMTVVNIDTGNNSQVSAWKSVATNGNFADRAVLYDPRCDEPGSNAAKWSTCRTVVNTVRSAWPGLPNVMTSNIDEVTANNATDITDSVTPVIDQIDGKAGTAYTGNQRPRYDSFLSQPGKRLWLYTSCDATGCGGANENDPYYTGWVDYTIDAAASQNRAMGWMEYEYGATGELYYDVDLKLATAWNDQWAFGGNGDGTLFYPGTTDRIGGTHAIPIDSLRMKLIRNGNQDYEYLRIAAQGGHAAEATQIARTLYPSTHDTITTDAAVESARHQLADLIAPSNPPNTVTVMTPAAGSTISGTTTMSASATAPRGVAGVQFLVDGTAYGAEATASPYNTALDTAGLSTGSHTIAARLRASDGSTATSAAITVTVANKTAPGHLALVGSLGISPENQTTAAAVTASFTVTNDGGSALSVPYLLTGARTSTGGNTDFPASGPLTLQPGQQYTWSASQTLPAGSYTAWPAYYTGTDWIELSAAHTAFTVNQPTPGHLALVGSLSVTPNPATTARPVTASFTVTNDGGSTISIPYFLTGNRTASGAHADFPASSTVTLQPGQRYTYTDSQTLAPSNYTAWPAYYTGATWIELAPTHTAYTVSWPGPGHLALVCPMILSPTAPTAGHPVTATFTVTNDGGSPISIPYLLTGARTSAGGNVDFPASGALTLQPGQRYTWSADRTLPAGNYTAWPAYYTGTNWIELATTHTAFTVH